MNTADGKVEGEAATFGLREGGSDRAVGGAWERGRADGKVPHSGGDGVVD